MSSRSSADEKIALFRSLFRGRENVFPKRWENSRPARRVTHWPVATNGSRVCAASPGSSAAPSQPGLSSRDGRSDYRTSTWTSHDRRLSKLAEGTCWFLAADFDKETWQQDVNTFLDACRSRQVPAAVERSRSGNGGHVWIFFAEPVPGALARRLGALLLTEAMNAIRISASGPTTGSFPARTRCPKAASATSLRCPFKAVRARTATAFSSTTISRRLPTSGPFCRRCGACPWRRRRRLPTKPVGKAGSWALAYLSMTMTRNPGPRRPRGADRRRRLPDPCRRGSTSFWAIRSTFRAPVCRQVWSTGSFVSRPSRTRRSTARRQCGAPPLAFPASLPVPNCSRTT